MLTDIYSACPVCQRQWEPQSHVEEEGLKKKEGHCQWHGRRPRCASFQIAYARSCATSFRVIFV